VNVTNLPHINFLCSLFCFVSLGSKYSFQNPLTYLTLEIGTDTIFVITCSKELLKFGGVLVLKTR
jgi:hypothetical protein